MRSEPVITFLGGTGTVTGSRFLVDTGRARVLVDCGLFQGLKELRRRNWAPFPVAPEGIDAVVLTHAHVDHTGYLPALVRDGFRGPVVATPGTVGLCRVLLLDAAHLQEEEARFANQAGYSKHRPALPLYTTQDAEHALLLLEPVHEGVRRNLAPGVDVELQPAGHILGSASVLLHLDGPPARRLLVSGDLGRDAHPLFLPPPPPPAADAVLVESTYGDRAHPDTEAGIEALASVVRRTAERGGSVVVPSFAVDRTEVVLHVLRRLRAEGRIPDLPVYADSPMALTVLAQYRRAVAHRDPTLRPEILDGPDPFDPGNLHECHSVDESKALNDLVVPSIIISASGMATGGRVLHHLARRLPDPRHSVVLPGFQAAGTRGRALADGAAALKLLGQYVPVRAEVAVIEAFSVHADADELVDWLGRAPEPPELTCCVHGEPEAAAALRDRIAGELHRLAVVPDHGERVRLR
jgi:metallo-beta-lactamase family protein